MCYQVSEDEIVVSDCELQDISVAPLLDALHAHKTVAIINLSHNLLGNFYLLVISLGFSDFKPVAFLIVSLRKYP